MNKRLLISGILSMAALTFMGCSTDEIEVEGGSSSNAITFGTSATTRANATTTNNLQSFGVSAAYTVNGFTNSTPMNFMAKQEVRREEGDTWTYSPMKYWPANSEEQLHFFAYSPYDNSNFQMSGNEQTGTPTVTVSLPDNLAETQDFITAIALNQRQTDSGNKVNFSFRHEMTQVIMEAAVNSNILNNETGDAAAKVAVTSLTIQNANGSNELYTKATYTFPTSTNSHGTWSGCIPVTDGISLASILNTDCITSTTHSPLFTNGSGLFLIPVNGTTGMTAGAIQAVMTYTINNESKTATVPLPTGSLKQGYAYTFTFLINSDNVELRTHESSVEELAKNANAFIVNPASGYEPSYRIPLDQLRRFWKESVYAGNEAEDNILENEEWTAEVIWQDIPTQVVKFVDDWGRKSDKFYGVGDNHFNFQLTSAATSHFGNVIVGIKKRGVTDEYLWSYHLWITDYAPKEYSEVTINNHVAEVTNGRVFQYEDNTVGYKYYRVVSGVQEKTVTEVTTTSTNGFRLGNYWSTNPSTVIMDRNLGAISDKWDTSETDAKKQPGVLYYQYGRPTPLPNERSIYKIDGTTSAGEVKIEKATAMISDGIKHPLVLYTDGSGSNWVKEANSVALNFWNSTTPKTDDIHYNKSLLDPSPAGWKVPVNGTWDIFGTNEANEKASYRAISNADAANSGSTYHGVNFYPMANGVAGSPTTFYPLVGHRYGKDGNVVPNAGYYWSANTTSANAARYLQFDGNGVLPQVGYGQSNALAIRCIQE